jgi:hypothetical protein
MDRSIIHIFCLFCFTIERILLYVLLIVIARACHRDVVVTSSSQPLTLPSRFWLVNGCCDASSLPKSSHGWPGCQLFSPSYYCFIRKNPLVTTTSTILLLLHLSGLTSIFLTFLHAQCHRVPLNYIEPNWSMVVINSLLNAFFFLRSFCRWGLRYL